MGGPAEHGGDSSGVDLTNVESAMCGGHACIAMNYDGTAQTWGDVQYGGDISTVDLTNLKMCGKAAESQEASVGERFVTGEMRQEDSVGELQEDSVGRGYKVQLGYDTVVYGLALIGIFSIAYLATLQCQEFKLQVQFD